MAPASAMNQQLDAYKAKRDFSKTPEPSGRRRKAKAGNSYVIQKHAARRLHYDFRLELDGVLKSWAVPEGPSLVPGEKRLAVEVEDHPLEYGGFEGVIPKGEYGAGTVMIWDRGTWTPEFDPDARLPQGPPQVQARGREAHGPLAPRPHGAEATREAAGVAPVQVRGCGGANRRRAGYPRRDAAFRHDRPNNGGDRPRSGPCLVPRAGRDHTQAGKPQAAEAGSQSCRPAQCETRRAPVLCRTLPAFRRGQGTVRPGLAPRDQI